MARTATKKMARNVGALRAKVRISNQQLYYWDAAAVAFKLPFWRMPPAWCVRRFGPYALEVLLSDGLANAARFDSAVPLLV